MPVATCPCREELIDYVVGKLSDQASDGLASHLDACPQCQAELASLPDPDDTLIARLRGTAPSDPFQDEPGCGRAVARALAVGENNSSAADLPRQLGEYQLLQRLGSGGMGTVYKARQGRLDRVVALKILLRGRTDDPRAIVRFEREMKAIGRLDHPNIVRAYDAREIDGTPVLIMEFVDGLDLAEIVRRAGVPALAGAIKARSASERDIGTGGTHSLARRAFMGIPVPDACELVRRTALALQCAHDHGLVHRDIKPSNIMLARSGEVKLLDLGLARFLAGDCPSFCVSKNGTVPFPAATEETTGTGQAMGTADYMAPEQASDSRTVDIRADIYSLGCTLYKLLSGRAPFSGPEYCATLDKMNAHVQQSPRPIRQIVPDVPEPLAKVLDRMLAKDPSARFTTPAEVAEAVVPFCAGADLVALLKRAETSGVEGSAASESNNLPSPSGRGAGGEGRRWKRFAGQIVALAVVGGLCFALGILITIKKNGQTYQVEVPGNSRTVVDQNGNATVNIGESRQAGSDARPAPVVVNPTAELKALRGQWSVVRVEKGSAAETTWQPDDKDFLHAGVQFCFEDTGGAGAGGHSMLEIPRLGEGTFAQFTTSVGSSAAPKWIDLYESKFQIGGQPGTRMQLGGLYALGLYEIDGDRLRLCLAKYRSGGTQRPKGFAVEPLSGQVSLELERYRPSADEKKLQDSTPVLREIVLDGETVFANAQTVKSNTSRILSGKTIRPVNTRRNEADVFLSFSTGRCALMNAHLLALGYDRATMRSVPAYPLGEVGKWQYVLDPAAQPKTMTFVAATPEKGKEELLGVYKLDGDQLTIAYHNGAPRPEKFESAVGSGVTLMVLQLQQSPGSRSGRRGGSRGGFAGGSRDTPNSAAAPPTVRVTQPVVCNVCDYEEYSGRIEKGKVPVTAPAKGKLVFLYGLGGTVKEGDTIAVILPENEWAALQPKLAPISERLVAAQRQLDKTLPASPLLAQGEHDEAVQKALKERESACDEMNSTLRNLKSAKVLAPCSGELSLEGIPSDFDIGTLIGTIKPTDATLVTFDVPESTVLAHRRLPNHKPNWELSLPVVCALADDKGFPYRGKVVSVAEGIDRKTHAQRWQAIVPNKDGIFLSGMTVWLRLVTSAPHKAMLIPDVPDAQEPDGRFSIKVMDERNVIRDRAVRLGRYYDEFRSVVDGLKPADWVVVDGPVGASEFKAEKVTTPPPPWASVDLTPPAASPAVSVVHPIVRDVTDYQQFRGYIVAARSAEIRARVTGNLVNVHVKPGMAVKQGDLLFEIDPRLYQSEVDHAASAVREAQVRLDQRTKELKRFEQLLKNAAVSQDEYDRVKSQCEEAAAAIKTAEAAMTTARLRLDFTKVTAPFNGKITGGLLDEGNLVTADVTQLTTILSTDPVSVVFVIPATVLAKIRGNSHGGPDPAVSLPVFCRLTGDKGFDYRAKMDSIESRVEAGGGVMCRAVLANKEDRFAPGMAVDVRVAIGGPHKALLVPESALSAIGVIAQESDVFIVNDRNVVEVRKVATGQIEDGLRVVTEGATAEDWIIPEFHKQSDRAKLRPGMTVTPEKAASP